MIERIQIEIVELRNKGLVALFRNGRDYRNFINFNFFRINADARNRYSKTLRKADERE